MHFPNAAQLLLVLCLSSLTPSLCTPTDDCKASPGSRAWPLTDAWEGLDQALGGRLFAPSPPGAVCHPGQPTYSADQCSRVRKGWAKESLHDEDPVSLGMDQFSNYTCLPDPEAPCSGRGYPSYVVNATTAEHVKVSVDFARRHNVRLIVKSSGHDFMGRSIAPGALSIWVHHMNGIEYHPGSFRLGGSGRVVEGNAVTVGGGAQLRDIYRAADRHNQTVVGGMCHGVGIAGYITGGGHSVLGPRYGMGADNVLQMELVTPGGELLTVNEDCHAHLFWALRGGGGSTFGVVTKVTLRTHPTPRIGFVNWMATMDPDAPFFGDVITYIASKTPYLADAGLSGYSLITAGMPNPVPMPGAPKEIAGVIGFGVIQDPDDAHAAQRMLRPINDTIRERWQGKVSLVVKTEQFPSFQTWFDAKVGLGPGGQSLYQASWLLDEKAFTGDTEALGRALRGVVGKGGDMVYVIATKGMRNAAPRRNAIHPAWSTAYGLVVANANFAPHNKTAELEAVRRLDTSFQPGLPYEKDWQRAFWGDNYERLLRIKRAVDPTDVFWCAPCVGNERWRERQDGRLCRLADMKVAQR